MRYWRNYRYRRYRPRTRRYWRRRTRGFVSRRFWRSRRYRVRKKKLKTIRLKQWQPHYIKKLRVKGDYPLFLTTSQRLSNNVICYLESTVPHDWPGGGGFSVANFTLEMLYKENLTASNYWTVSNDNMPLFRYLGCHITLFTQPEVDYLFYYNNTPPMKATKLTYMSTQPSIMLQIKHVKVIKCRKTNRKKPYKRFYVPPPTQMQNKWYAQHDLANVPLLQTISTVCSLDRKFLHANAKSTNITISSINTEEISNHYFSMSQGTTGYNPKPEVKLFAVHQMPAKREIEQIQIGDLIYLGQVYSQEPGTPIKNINTATTTFQDKLTKALTNSGYQGNPFYKDYLNPDTDIVKTTKDLNTLKTTYTSATITLKKNDFSFTAPLIKETRYNPFKDKGVGNKVYLVKILEQTHSHNWDPPTDEDIVWTDLPLYLLTWGYLDFQRKCGIQSSIDTNNCLVIYSPYMDPPLNTKTYVPVDNTFLQGHSPYSQTTFPSDYTNFHPKVRFQVDIVNTIACTGPNTVKLPDNISCEAHMRYNFKFKIGGEPAPMSVLVDPQKQPPNTFPNNFLQSTSLQNPTKPLEYFLWKFDERRGLLTKKASERIKTHKETEKDILSITEPATSCPIWTTKEASTTDSSSTEEEETSIETQLLHERRKQKLLRKRINQLLNRLTILE
nr:MAG: ORF1 [TTV-like mini virus]